MNKRFFPIVVVALVAVAYYKYRERNSTPDSIVYQGESIKLSKHFSEYEDYKDDPDNIAASDLPKAQGLVRTAPIAHHFASENDLSHAMFFDMEFPGYGIESFGDKPQPDGTVLSLWSIEIPHADQERFFLFRGRGGAFDLVDDFVAPDDPAIEAVRVVGDRFVYTNQQGANVIERAGVVH